MENTDKLLAEFLGMKPHHNDSNVVILNINGINYPFEVSELNYDTDWNRLMQVVEKIESLGYKETNVYVDISEGTFIHTLESNIEIAEVFGGTKIENTYNACVEFVKWYNEQKK